MGKIVFSPEYIFAKVGVVWIRGIFDRVAAQDQSDAAQNQSDGAVAGWV
jgi:predicted aminopeptidase